MKDFQVAITFEDKQAVESKGIGRKVIDRLYQTYSSELGCKRFVYDGGKTLYTVGPLPLNKYEFKVLLEKSFTKRYVLCMTVLFASCFIFPLNLTVPTLAVVPTAKSPGANGSLNEETKRTPLYFSLTLFIFSRCVNNCYHKTWTCNRTPLY